MRRGCTQATGQKGPHERGGGIAHQSTACIPNKGKQRKTWLASRKCAEHRVEQQSDLHVHVKTGGGTTRRGRCEHNTGGGGRCECACVSVRERERKECETVESSRPSHHRERSHLTAEYTLSQAPSLSLLHTLAPDP